MNEQVRIVVGEGRAMRRGLLRFVLEGEGYQVVAEATTVAELGRVLAVHRPDLVVLDDGIGAMAVGMTREMVPDAKIILVWPRAVVPVGGDARVDPSDVLRELGPAVARVATPTSETGLTAVPPLAERPPWIERVRKDRSALRERLAKATPPPSEGPSVTQLQRRGQRLHPLSRKRGTDEEQPATEGTGSGEPIIDDSGPAPVVILPPGEAETPEKPEDQREDKTAAAGVVVPIGAAAAAGVGAEAAAGEAEKEAKTEEGTGTGAGGKGAVAAAAAAGAVAAGHAARNRRIGAVVLTGAAATAALVVALVLPNRISPTLHAQPSTPTSAPTSPGGGHSNGGDHNDGNNRGNGGGVPGNGNGGHGNGGRNGIYPPVPRYARAYVYGRG
jgi:chemotaxis response regulator CheB